MNPRFPRTALARALAWTPLAGAAGQYWSRLEAAQAAKLGRMRAAGQHGTPAYWRQVDTYDDIADAVCVLTRKAA